MDVGGVEVWKGFKRFRSLPCVERSEFMVRMVEYNLVAQVFLKLSEKAGCKTRLLFKMCCVKTPLVLKERLQVLAE